MGRVLERKGFLYNLTGGWLGRGSTTRFLTIGESSGTETYGRDGQGRYRRTRFFSRGDRPATTQELRYIPATRQWKVGPSIPDTQ